MPVNNLENNGRGLIYKQTMMKNIYIYILKRKRYLYKLQFMLKDTKECDLEYKALQEVTLILSFLKLCFRTGLQACYWASE